MKVRWLAIASVGLTAFASGCRLGATSRLHEEPTRIDVVYCEALPITIVAPSGDASGQVSRIDDEETR